MRLGDICVDMKLKGLMIALSRGGMVRINEVAVKDVSQGYWERKISIEYSDWFSFV